MAGGVSVTLKIIGKYNWRNHLIQGGLEGSCEMSRSVVNHLLLTRYEKVPNELYIEPKNKEIVWTFFLVGNEDGKRAEAKSRQQKSNRRKKKRDQGTFGVCYQTQDQKRLTKKTTVLSCLLV